MRNKVTFVPGEAHAAEENLRKFVSLCRNELTVFGEDLNFDANVWDVTHSVKGNARRSRKCISFSAWGTNGRGKTNHGRWMSEPYVSFAKAHVRYMHGINPRKGNGSDIAALRALEQALIDCHCELVCASAEVFNRAAKLVADHFLPSTSYGVGKHLEAIAEFLSKNELVKMPFSWRSWIPRQGDTVRVGEKFDLERRSKLPSRAALEALPHIFRQATQTADVLVSSITAILCSAPDRINEVLNLPNNCEVRGDTTFGNVGAYGLRWWPSKGADPMIKWVIPSMSSVTAEALKKIRHHTDEGRKIAKWYELNPTQLYLAPEAIHLKGKADLSASEMSLILFGEVLHYSNLAQWLRANKVSWTNRGRRIVIRFSDLEAAVLRKLPRSFPYLDQSKALKFSEALFVIPLGAMHSRRSTYKCAIEAVNHTQIHTRLKTTVDSGYLSASIFERFGMREDDDSYIKVTTHQFRHYLNTLAQAGGMSQLDIAKWSGRRDIRQNSAYDHVSADTLLVQIREAVGDGHRMFGPLATVPETALISRDSFAQLKIPTAHTTDFGYCVHDYAMSPCQLHRDCLNCNELVCVKGNDTFTRNLYKRRCEVTALLVKARAAEREEYFGASRWVEHHTAELERLNDLCEILENPYVPVGGFIQVGNSVQRNQKLTSSQKSISITPSEPLHRSS